MWYSWLYGYIASLSYDIVPAVLTEGLQDDETNRDERVKINSGADFATRLGAGRRRELKQVSHGFGFGVSDLGVNFGKDLPPRSTPIPGCQTHIPNRATLSSHS